jgi:EAL domain-containing protein (putative c-di-GMP-specific phosphodiesterase class I)
MRTIPIVEANPNLAWLESTPREGQQPLRAELDKLPFTIGRNENCDLPIETNRISREHVRIECIDGVYYAKDLKSTNGTFINGVRINQQSPLTDGDLLTVANVGLIFHLPKSSNRSQATQRFSSPEDLPIQPAKESPLQIIEAIRSLQEFLLQRGVRNHLQSIVRMEDSETLGYELRPSRFDGSSRLDTRLPRGLHCRALRRASELSRSLAVEQAWNAFGDVLMFLPASLEESSGPEFLESLDRLKQRPTGEARLVFQIPTEALGHGAELSQTCRMLKEAGVAVAVDRFSGAASELEVLRAHPPSYIKLAPSVARSLVGSSLQLYRVEEVLRIAHDLDAKVIACGVSSEEEWQACKNLGVQLAQGDFAAAAMPLDACLTHKR